MSKHISKIHSVPATHVSKEVTFFHGQWVYWESPQCPVVAMARLIEHMSHSLNFDPIQISLQMHTLKDDVVGWEQLGGKPNYSECKRLLIMQKTSYYYINLLL